jgi:hypothetical protein
MSIRFHPKALLEEKPRDYALRFGLGGAITAVTGLVAHAFGPAVGGLFLAFPAILPASLTLVEQKDGARRAADDATGATLGSFGLVAFGAIVWGFGEAAPPATTLLLATLAWWITSVAMWRGARGPY